MNKSMAEMEAPVAKSGDMGIRTLMFTDIEGSTDLLQELGADYPAVLGRHQEIVRACFNRFGGIEDGTQGDSFVVVFDNAADALAAAIDIQRSLAAEAWTHDGDLRVRIGLHEGEVGRLGGQLVGLDVHLAARIGDTGHGGQIVMSRTTRNALSDVDLDRWNVSTRPLGPHRLKAIRYPVTLFDVVDPQIKIDFPPIRSAEARRTNITQPRGPIVGRDREVDEILSILDAGHDRLVTITGMGGTGKTSVAQRIAALWLDGKNDGAYFVDLSGLEDSGLVFPTVAQVMGVRDYPGRPVQLDVAANIGVGRVLLVFDTFEHVAQAAVGVGDLLNECPNLRILVTSRAELRIEAERTYPLLPLSLPDPSDPAPETSGAMRLFVETVKQETPEFTVTADNRGAIAEIVRRLEGIPLALNLAAARMSLLSPDQLLRRLDTQLKLLRSTRQDSGRHRTLRSAIEWSDSLLEPDEREIFLRLSVFVGGFRVDDAEEILLDMPDVEADVLDAVSSLVSKNLLHRRMVQGVPRFGMFDMVREYASEALDKAGAKTETEQVFGSYYAGFADKHGARALSTDQYRHVTRLGQEADNIRAALRDALEGEDVETAARIIKSLYWYWISQGHITESLGWIEQACALTDRLGESAASAMIDMAAAYTKAMAGDYGGAYPHGERAERIFTDLGEVDASRQAALIHAICGAASGAIEDPSETIMGCIEHMQQRGDTYFTALGLIIMGEGARMEGMREAAEDCYGQALELLAEDENTFWPGLLKQNIAHFRLAEGNREAATALLAEAYDLGQDYDYPLVMTLCVAGFGGVAVAGGDATRAARFLGAVDHYMSQIGASFEPTDKADIDGYVEQTRNVLGPTAYNEAARAGAAENWDAIRAEARSLAAT